MKILGKGGRLIESWEDWERPLRDSQWAEGRSAMEIARAFFRDGEPRLPRPLADLLRSVQSLSAFVADEARLEFKTDLPPKGASGPRNHDVWVRGQAGELRVCVGIEAKADEAFDHSLSKKLADAYKKSVAGLGTDLPARLAALGTLLFGHSFDLARPSYQRLGYQLLSGTAGTAIQASRDGTSTAVFAVYEFITRKTRAENHDSNAADLDAFVGLLPGGFTGVVPGQLVGPIRLTASAILPRAVELFIGKVQERL
jgi:hypothetical protein